MMERRSDSCTSLPQPLRSTTWAPRIPFIPVANPRLRSAPPTGPEWLHEVKFDGFRVQLHKAGADVRLYSRNGKDFIDRFPSIVAAVRRLRTNQAVIDGELWAAKCTEQILSCRQLRSALRKISWAGHAANLRSCPASHPARSRP